MDKREFDKLSNESKWNVYSGKEDTREDCSDIFYCDNDGVAYINPDNKMQLMYVDENGFQMNTDYHYKPCAKDRGQKIVWQKVESINELKKGDLVRFWNEYNIRNYNIGLITCIEDDNIHHQFWSYDGISVGYAIVKFRIWENVEKAVIVEE